MFQAYALGWGVRDYRGTKIISHGGAVLGFQSVVVLIPDKNVGFAIEINSEDGEIALGLMYELLDHYLGFPANGWPEKFAAYKQERLAGALKALDAVSAKPAKVGPSLPLARYAGVYADPWYGNIEVAVQGKSLAIDFKSTPRMGGRLEHWQYDTFITRFEDTTIEPAYVTFGLDADGRVARVTMKPVSPLADFSYDYSGPVVHARRGRGGMSKTSQKDCVEKDRVGKDESGSESTDRVVESEILSRRLTRAVVSSTGPRSQRGLRRERFLP